MRVWGITDTGLVRKENQDAYFTTVVKEFQIGVVCDGMGGTNGGQVASRIAVDCFRREIAAALQSDMTPQQVGQTMSYAASLAHTAIRKTAQEVAEYEKMGTTLVGAVCRKDMAVICNIGDSRAYHITKRGIEQISRDHSVVESMIENGEITQAQAKHHPNRNLITRALGPDMEAKADIFSLPWREGEFILLCTDGLVNTVSDQEILFEVIHSAELDGCLERLLEVAKSHGAPDNVTAVLIENLPGKEMA